MRYRRRRMLTAFLMVMMLALTACGGEAANGADSTKTGTTERQPESNGKTKESGSGGDAATEATDNATEAEPENTREDGAAFLPLGVQNRTNLIDVKNDEWTHRIVAEYPVLTVGEYEWDGSVINSGNRRYDALEARLSMLNGEFADSKGVEWIRDYLSQTGVEIAGNYGVQGFQSEYDGSITMYDRVSVKVTRSDEYAVSLLLYTRSDAMLSELPVTYRTYVLDPETGKDLRLENVVTDMEAFLDALADAAQRAQSDRVFLEHLADREAAEEAARSFWTLDYDGITVYAASYDASDLTNVPCVTVPFSEYPELFRAPYTETPADYMIEMVEGRTYPLPGREETVRVDYGAVTGQDTVPQHPVTLTLQDDKMADEYAKNYPPHYLVHTGGRDFVLMDPPRFDVSFSLYVYDLNGKDLSDAVLEQQGLGAVRVLHPHQIVLYDDPYTFGEADVPWEFCVAFGHYEIDADGSFRALEDFRYLEGRELTVRQQVETLGYRRHDEGTLVNKTLARGTQVKPYRTDRETFIEFESGGDVFRFDLNSYGADMKLNGVYTFHALFGE